MKKEAILKIYTTYRLIIFPLVVILSCCVLIFFVIYPQVSKLVENFQTEGQLKTRFEVLDTKAQTLEGIDETDLRKKLELALNVYPSEHDFSSVVGILQAIASKFDFTVISLHLSGGPTQGSKNTSKSFDVKLELIGAKMLVKSLISNIENYPRLMKVNGVEVLSTRGGDEVNIALSLEVYYQQLPDNAGSVDSPVPTLSEKEEAILASLVRPEVVTEFAQAPQTQYSIPLGKTNPFE